MSSTSTQLLLLTGLVASHGLASEVGYAQATGYLKKDARPTLYQPLNLLDARDATAWCSPTADPLNEMLTFGFNGEVTLEEIRLSTGNNFDQKTWSEFARAKKFALKSGKQTEIFSVEDIRGIQSIAFKTAMKGERFSLEVLDQYPADDIDAPVCMSDVVFIAEGKPLNGAWLTSKLKFDKWVAVIMGTWYAGYEGTPDRYLSFNYNGNFRYSHEPFDKVKTQPKVSTGTFEVSGNKLTLDLAGKKHALRFSKDAARGHGFALTLEGDVPADLKGPWRSAP
jgi:hypothetical protein